MSSLQDRLSNCQKLSQCHQKIVIENFHQKIVIKKCHQVPKVLKVLKVLSQVMSPQHSDQMSQWQQVSWIALCMAEVNVSELVSQSQGHLLSCSGKLKRERNMDSIYQCLLLCKLLNLQSLRKFFIVLIYYPSPFSGGIFQENVVYLRVRFWVKTTQIQEI